MAMLRRGIDTQQMFYPGTSGNQTARDFMPGRVAAAQQMMGMPPQMGMSPQMGMPPQQTQVPVATPMQQQAPKSASRPQSQGFRPKRKMVSGGRKRDDSKPLRDAKTATDVVGAAVPVASAATKGVLAAAPALAATTTGAALSAAVPVAGPLIGGIAALASYFIGEEEKRKAIKQQRKEEAMTALRNTLQSRFS